ncbi:hypothetical protein B1218_38050 [Pseudomonas ogarae]|nr:hypothetical protein B1218_38050 [Pseudomonas ogarae]
MQMPAWRCVTKGPWGQTGGRAMVQPGAAALTVEHVGPGGGGGGGGDIPDGAEREGRVAVRRQGRGAGVERPERDNQSVK